ncbi:MAG: EamA family transporter [Ktedonobacteraceae bacterium]
MNNVALLLVVISAFFHATWNLLAKRTNGGATTVWQYDVASTIIYAPFTIILLVVQHVQIGIIALIFICGSGLLHLTYFILLQRGYRVGDLSFVYPLSRGIGPFLATIIAITVFGECPTIIAFIGMLLVVTGVFLLVGGLSIIRRVHDHRAFLYALIIGLFIAGYTLWDKQAVSVVRVLPTLYYYGIIIIRMLLLTPYALRHRKEIRLEWRAHRFDILGVAILSPISYFLVLTALVFTPVSYVAPAREMSVLIGTFMGARLLAEGDTRRRLLAAAVILLGIIALAVG